MSEKLSLGDCLHSQIRVLQLSKEIVKYLLLGGWPVKFRFGLKGQNSDVYEIYEIYASKKGLREM